MDLRESKIHSFIVKLWVEEAGENEPPLWHGYITHVPSGGRRYLKTLSDILNFIKEYLDSSEARVSLKSRVTNWLGRRRVEPPKEG